MPRIDGSDLLLVIDVQPDFCPGGALAVPDGDAVIDPINALMGLFPRVVATQDWHPRGHASFASSHPGRQPFETIDLGYGPQTLWPDHCVQGTAGAALHPRLRQEPITLVVRKGHHREIDSYSAFQENDRATTTGLAGFLRECGVKRIFCAGLALDYCVRWSAEDAQRLGFEAWVVTDACRAIDQSGSLEQAMAAMEEAGVHFVTVAELAGAKA